LKFVSHRSHNLDMNLSDNSSAIFTIFPRENRHRILKTSGTKFLYTICGTTLVVDMSSDYLHPDK